MSNSYKDFSASSTNELNRVIAESFLEERSLDETIKLMQQAVEAEVWKLRRIARTEIINVTNEGRLAAYKRLEVERGEQFRYTLIVAPGLRTCDAHRELSTRIPKRGLPLDELILLQMEVGAKFSMTLTGNSLLHPNQRTVLARVA